MSTSPNGYQTPKTNWQSADVVAASDFNRIEGNIAAIETGERTIDPAQAPSSNVGSLRQLLDWFANRIKAITGATNWYDAPATTLAAAKSHIDAAAPHTGHETPAGAQAKVDSHAALTTAHGSTPAATAGAIMQRDANGRAQVAVPSAAADIARKDTVDAVQTNLTSHLTDKVHVPYAIATGSANAYAVTISGITAYQEGLAVAVKINVDNTGASTLNVNGLGAVAIKKPNGLDVAAGNLKANSIYTMRYNGTNFILQGEMGVGNAQPADVLSGKTFTNDQGEQVGTMPNRGAVVITPGTSNTAIPAGYHNGAGYVVGDPDLVAGNIKAGVDIFGVVGSYAPTASSASGTENEGSDKDITTTVSFPAGKSGVVIGWGAWYTSMASPLVTLYIGGVQVASRSSDTTGLRTIHGYRAGLSGPVAVRVTNSSINSIVGGYAVWA